MQVCVCVCEINSIVYGWGDSHVLLLNMLNHGGLGDLLYGRPDCAAWSYFLLSLIINDFLNDAPFVKEQGDKDHMAKSRQTDIIY